MTADHPAPDIRRCQRVLAAGCAWRREPMPCAVDSTAREHPASGAAR